MNISIYSVFIGQEISTKRPIASDMWEIAVGASEGSNSEYFLSEADAWSAYETTLAHPVVECNDAGNQVFSCRIITEAIVTEERFNEARAAGKSLREIYDDCSHDGRIIESEMSSAELD